MKIMDWIENKERNIRALLCSMNSIVWEGCNWTPIGMHQLLTPNDVKKMYRKACLAVHPDKVSKCANILPVSYVVTFSNLAGRQSSRGASKVHFYGTE